MKTRSLAIILLCSLLAGAGGSHGAAPRDAAAVMSEAAGASARAADLLAAGRTDADVQSLQRQVAEAIARLADELSPEGGAPTSLPGESQEGELTRQGTVTTEPDLPGEESVLPAGDWAVGRLRGEPAGAWQPRLPAAELKKLSDALAGGRLPAHYRERLRAYGRRLAQDSVEGTGSGE